MLHLLGMPGLELALARQDAESAQRSTPLNFKKLPGEPPVVLLSDMVREPVVSLVLQLGHLLFGPGSFR